MSFNFLHVHNITKSIDFQLKIRINEKFHFLPILFSESFFTFQKSNEYGF